MRESGNMPKLSKREVQLDMRFKAAALKRSEQLKRWERSVTNYEEATARPEKERNVRFSSSCVFLSCCLSGDKDEAERLLKYETNVNCTNADGLTALHQACIDENFDMIKFLVEHGADVNQRDSEGWTSLHATAACGFVNIARYLIDNGADLAAINCENQLPIDLAAKIQHLPMIEYLQQLMDELKIDCKMARQAEERLLLTDAKMFLLRDPWGINRQDPKTGATPLHVAAAKGYIKVLKLLLEGNALVNKQDYDGWTPLHAAAHWNQKEACLILLNAKANQKIRTFTGKTCLDVADPRLVEYLKDNIMKKEKRPRSMNQNRTLYTTANKNKPRQCMEYSELSSSLRQSKSDLIQTTNNMISTNWEQKPWPSKSLIQFVKKDPHEIDDNQSRRNYPSHVSLTIKDTFSSSLGKNNGISTNIRCISPPPKGINKKKINLRGLYNNTDLSTSDDCKDIELLTKQSSPKINDGGGNEETVRELDVKDEKKKNDDVATSSTSKTTLKFFNIGNNDSVKKQERNATNKDEEKADSKITNQGDDSSNNEIKTGGSELFKDLLKDVVVESNSSANITFALANCLQSCLNSIKEQIHVDKFRQTNPKTTSPNVEGATIATIQSSETTTADSTLKVSPATSSSSWQSTKSLTSPSETATPTLTLTTSPSSSTSTVTSDKSLNKKISIAIQATATGNSTDTLTKNKPKTKPKSKTNSNNQAKKTASVKVDSQTAKKFPIGKLSPRGKNFAAFVPKLKKKRLSPPPPPSSPLMFNQKTSKINRSSKYINKISSKTTISNKKENFLKSLPSLTLLSKSKVDEDRSLHLPPAKLGSFFDSFSKISSTEVDKQIEFDFDKKKEENLLNTAQSPLDENSDSSTTTFDHSPKSSGHSTISFPNNVQTKKSNLQDTYSQTSFDIDWDSNNDCDSLILNNHHVATTADIDNSDIHKPPSLIGCDVTNNEIGKQNNSQQSSVEEEIPSRSSSKSNNNIDITEKPSTTNLLIANFKCEQLQAHEPFVLNEKCNSNLSNNKKHSKKKGGVSKSSSWCLIVDGGNESNTTPTSTDPNHQPKRIGGTIIMGSVETAQKRLSKFMDIQTNIRKPSTDDVSNVSIDKPNTTAAISSKNEQPKILIKRSQSHMNIPQVQKNDTTKNPAIENLFATNPQDRTKNSSIHKPNETIFQQHQPTCSSNFLQKEEHNTLTNIMKHRNECSNCYIINGGDEHDYRALWLLLKRENQILRQQLRQRDDEMNRMKQSFDNFTMEQFKAYQQENQRLKEETAALIRVICKLNK